MTEVIRSQLMSLMTSSLITQPYTCGREVLVQVRHPVHLPPWTRVVTATVRFLDTTSGYHPSPRRETNRPVSETSRPISEPEPTREAGTGQEPGMVNTRHGHDLARAARGIRYTSIRSHSPHGDPRILYTPADHGRSWLRNPTLEGPALDPAEIPVCKELWAG